MTARREPVGQRQRDGLVRLAPERVERLCRRLGWSKEKLANKAKLSRNTVLSMFRGKGVFNSSAAALAGALGVDVEELCFSEGATASNSAVVYGLPTSDEWEPVRYTSPWITAANGLQFRVCQMRHRHIKERLGRGKFYDLLDVPTDRREGLRAMLLRHPVVAGRLEVDPHVAVNLCAAPAAGGEGWWVVDQWVGETALSQGSAREPLPAAALARLMREIAEGLAALHAAGIVFRELAPWRVLLAERDGRAVLTDFELAKLLDGSPTVSPDADQWPDDDYRAPEVESGNFDKRADLYSFARIFLLAATGRIPPVDEVGPALTRLAIPRRVLRVTIDCLAPDACDRPRNIQAVQTIMANWV